MKDHDFDNKTHLLAGQINVTHEEYETMALGHLKELWTNYGELTEIWFDGGYTNTTKNRIKDMLDQYQPNAIVWRGQGMTPSTVAWIGTESGFPEEPDEIWSTGCSTLGGLGDPDSMHWCPKGCDTTLHKYDKWFYIPEIGVRSLETMVDIYHRTVGRNGVLELGVAVDKTGRIPQNHAQTYEQMGDFIRACYGTPLQTWVRKDVDLNGYVLELELDKPKVEIDRILLREDQWRGGQRIRQYTIHVQLEGAEEGEWTLFSKGQSIGNKRIDLYKKNTTTSSDQEALQPITIQGRIRFHAVMTTDVPMLREVSIFAPCPDPANFTGGDESSFLLHETSLQR